MFVLLYFIIHVVQVIPSFLYLQQDANKKIRADRVKELKDAKDQAEAKSKKQIDENNKKIQALQKRVCDKSLC